MAKNFTYLLLLLLFSMSLKAQWSNDSTKADNLVDSNVKTLPVLTGYSISIKSTQLVYCKNDVIYLQRLDDLGIAQFKPAIQVSQTGELSDTNYNMLADAEGVVVTYYDQKHKTINVQRFDITGQKLWGDSGVKISNILTPTLPFIASDANFGGVYIAWQDSVNKIKVFRIYHTGGSWLAPVDISSTNENKSLAGICEDAVSGLFVLFNQLVQNNIEESDIYAQHLDVFGNLLWTNNAKLLVSATGNQVAGVALLRAKSKVLNFNPSPFSLGFKFIYRDYAGSNDSSFILKTQDIDAEGNILWNVDGINVSGHRITDGGNEFLLNNNIFWNERKQGSSNQNVFGQYIDDNGNVLWAENRVNITKKNQDQLFPQAAITGNVQYIYLTWQDDSKLYMQKIDKYTGEVQLNVNGYKVCDVQNSKPQLPSISFSSIGTIITWLDHRSKNFVNIYSEKVPYETVLALSTLKFNAVLSKNNVYISWQTSNSINVSSYVIERSNDGRTFNDLDKINVNETNAGKSDFNITDNNPFNGFNYYRLKIVDDNGNVSYSEIKVVNISRNIVSIAPNPVHSVLQLQAQNVSNGICTIQISNSKGLVVLKKQITNQLSQLSTSINVSLLANGLYFLKLAINNDIRIVPFEKY